MWAVCWAEEMAVWKVDLSVGVLAGMTAASRAEMLVFPQVDSSVVKRVAM